MVLKAGPSFLMFVHVLELPFLNIYSGACTQDLKQHTPYPIYV